jgi:WD40 repeat protein/serine/threonine protein kinase
MNTDFEKIRQVFLAIVEEPSAQWDTLLDRACPNDTELRQQVAQLLRAHAGEDGILDRNEVAAVPTEAFESLSECAGTVIGPYKLLQQLGEGGMGTVFMAEQTEPIRRQVALKVIKPGMDSRQIIARFEAERQALALMDHVNIARVLDAGATESGRPYFVMELVHGVPITKYCDDNQLTPRERLELFVPVCQAIQHAHQKGIIHRDIKPSNVMITLYDGKPVAKVIDFGVAKAMDQKLTERTLFTQYGTMVGTFEYMSPEQAEMSALGVDTRSDIYSLGVLLYELLTGTTPIEKGRLRKVSYDELRRIIKEEEPPRPSTRISTLGQAGSTISALRKSDPKRLSRLVRGELDWVAMKCLEKDRNRRYETANGLIEDVQRYLHDEPVQACPPSLGYRLSKFARRNKGPVLAALLIALALLGGMIGTTWGMVLATDEARERGKAEKQARADQARAEEAEETANLRRDEAITQKNRALDQQYALGTYPLSRLWRDGSHLQVRRLLDALRPGPDEADLRGWEWHYQDRLSRGALRTLKGHHVEGMTGTAQGIAFSPDGRWLASCGGADSDQGELFLWDVATGKEVRRFHGQGRKLDLIVRVAFSPDGKTLATSNWVNTVRMWDVATGQILGTARSNLGTVKFQSLVFSPDGRLLASAAGSEDTSEDTVRVWEVASRKSLGRWKTGAVTTLAFHPEGQLLTVTPSAVTLHEPASGKVLRSFSLRTAGQPISPAPERDEDELESAAVSPDGIRLAVAARDGIWFWDLARGSKGKVLNERTKKNTSGLIFSPDGQRLASAGKNGTVEVWDLPKDCHLPPPAATSTGQNPRTEEWHELEIQPRRITIRELDEGIACVAFSSDGMRLAVAGRDGAIRIRDAAANGQESRLFRGLGGQLGFRGAAFTPDGEQFLVLPYDPPAPHGMVYLCDAVSGQILPGQSGGQGPVACSPDGRWLASGCKEGIRLWDSATCREVRTIPTKDKCARLTFVGDGRLVSVLWGNGPNSPRATHKIWDVATGRELATFSETDVLSPDGRRLAARTGGGPNQSTQLKVWDIDRPQMGEERPPAPFPPHTKILAGFTFSPDSKLLVTVGQDESWSLKFWDAATLKAAGPIPWPRNQSFGGVRFSADGRFLAASSSDLVKVWELTGKEVFTADGKEQGGALTFSPNGRYLAVSGPGRVKVWEVMTGRELLAYQGKERVMSLTFSPDSRYLAGFSREHYKVDYLKVWEVTGKEVVNYEAKWTPGQTKPHINLAFSPDSSALAASDIDGATRVWDLATGRVRFTLNVESPKPAGFIDAGICGMFGAGLAFSPDGRRLTTGNPVLHVWDAASGVELHSPGPIGPVTSMAVSPVGRTLATGQTLLVRLWDLDTRKTLRTFGGHNGEVSSITFSRDGRLLAASDGIWDLSEGRHPPGDVQPPTRRLEGQPKGIRTLAFSPNDQLLFSYGAGSVKAWDVASGRERSSGKFDLEKNSGVAFSPDGRLLAGGGDGTVRLWDLSENKEIRVLTVEDKLQRGVTVNALAFSPDGRRLAAVGARIIRIWDTRTFQELYTIARVGPTGGLTS